MSLILKGIDPKTDYGLCILTIKGELITANGKHIQAIPIVEEQKEGTWIHDIHYGLKLPEHRCSICGEWEYSDTESKYCPNCGAYMRGE